MKVNEFIDSGLNYRDILSGDSYIPIAVKQKIANDVINKCINVNNGFIDVDYFMMDIYFNMAMLNEYTILEFSDDIIDEYDTLVEKGIVDVIFTIFNDDCSRARKILDQELARYLRGNSIEAHVTFFISKLTDSLDSMTDLLENKIGDFNMLDLKDIDINALTEAINKLK